ncbi:hypothetical protein BZA05DRAFT_421684 [Tricharina praecox]|uniref:uncharacterized protein n=1 Tax=Tricharina praecox TaxID=43433 RepID=UPI0022207DA1|nr:uncharacterized protein BZA05DRAFT_421684 [Tricharina praecox]KAI5844750.1 hypothetical protein BZA05DRAFT_421684 [Tricharina praecox]
MQHSETTELERLTVTLILLSLPNELFFQIAKALDPLDSISASLAFLLAGDFQHASPFVQAVCGSTIERRQQHASTLLTAAIRLELPVSMFRCVLDSFYSPGDLVPPLPPTSVHFLDTQLVGVDDWQEFPLLPPGSLQTVTDKRNNSIVWGSGVKPFESGGEADTDLDDFIELDMINGTEMGPLNFAAARGDASYVKAMLEFMGELPAAWWLETRPSPLHWASFHFHRDVIGVVTDWMWRVHRLRGPSPSGEWFSPSRQAEHKWHLRPVHQLLVKDEPEGECFVWRSCFPRRSSHRIAFVSPLQTVVSMLHRADRRKPTTLDDLRRVTRILLDLRKTVRLLISLRQIIGRLIGLRNSGAFDSLLPPTRRTATAVRLLDPRTLFMASRWEEVAHHIRKRIAGDLLVFPHRGPVSVVAWHSHYEDYNTLLNLAIDAVQPWDVVKLLLETHSEVQMPGDGLVDLRLLLAEANSRCPTREVRRTPQEAHRAAEIILNLADGAMGAE